MDRRAFLPLILAAAAIGCREHLPATLEPGQTVAIRGEIEAGVECPMLVVSGGRRFALAGNLGQFQIGDRVCVKGKIAEMSFCMAGEGTIAVESIGAGDSCP